MYSLVSFDKCVHLNSHLHNQNIEHIHHPKKFPCILLQLIIPHPWNQATEIFQAL